MLIEKPLTYSAEDARRMVELAQQHGVLVLTNFETSWYASLREAKRLVESGEMAPVRRMVFRHGHKGPKEIGCSHEFLAWLTDPAQNGGGAIVDFGCYGAVLATWIIATVGLGATILSRGGLRGSYRRQVSPQLSGELSWSTVDEIAPSKHGEGSIR